MRSLVPILFSLLVLDLLISSVASPLSFISVSRPLMPCLYPYEWALSRVYVAIPPRALMLITCSAVFYSIAISLPCSNSLQPFSYVWITHEDSCSPIHHFRRARLWCHAIIIGVDNCEMEIWIKWLSCLKSSDSAPLTLHHATAVPVYKQIVALHPYPSYFTLN